MKNINIKGKRKIKTEEKEQKSKKYIELQKMFQEVKKEIEQLKIPISSNIAEEIKINYRAKSRFGCCKKIKTRMKVSYEIEISDRILQGKEKIIKQTLAHELLHTCPNCDNHGEEWKRYAELLKEAYGYDIKRTEKAENLGIPECAEKKPLENRYVLVCKRCGIEIVRTRMSRVIKNPQRYRCRCGGELYRIK